MEYQDAIDHIRELLTTLHANPNIYEDGTYNIIYVLEEFALSSLEKEISKEPVREFTKGGAGHPVCPTCKDVIPFTFKQCHIIWCPFCGQKLDWDLYEDNVSIKLEDK